MLDRWACICSLVLSGVDAWIGYFEGFFSMQNERIEAVVALNFPMAIKVNLL